MKYLFFLSCSIIGCVAADESCCVGQDDDDDASDQPTTTPEVTPLLWDGDCELGTSTLYWLEGQDRVRPRASVTVDDDGLSGTLTVEDVDAGCSLTVRISGDAVDAPSCVVGDRGPEYEVSSDQPSGGCPDAEPWVDWWGNGWWGWGGSAVWHAGWCEGSPQPWSVLFERVSCSGSYETEIPDSEED